MKLPTEEQCLNYFAEFKVPRNIKQHCIKVKELAVFLARKLKEAEVEINIDFVERLALLHDLFKVVALDKLEANKFYDLQYSDEEIEMWQKLRETYPNMHECDVAYLFFKDDFPELARSLKCVSKSFEEGKTTAEEIVAHYADWRIFNDEIVPLQERLEYLQERYSTEGDYWIRRAQIIKEKEAQLFPKLPFSPDQLKEMMTNGR